ESNKINIRRGVRQGDTISPKLFTATLESIFRRLTWKNRGLKIDGKYLSHLPFADDILICANKPHELQQMLQEQHSIRQRYSIRDNNQDKEIQRRITAIWAAFAKHRDNFKGNFGTCWKREVYNSCVLPAMTYGAETWALTKQAKHKLAAAQSKMERSMLNITYRNRNTNIWVRERTKVIVVMEQVRRRKWIWAGHISRIRDNRWTSRIT
ncbi:MAG: reverse transcriptase domain-containing protein, partial [Chromatiales bacterium]